MHYCPAYVLHAFAHHSKPVLKRKFGRILPHHEYMHAVAALRRPLGKVSVPERKRVGVHNYRALHAAAALKCGYVAIKPAAPVFHQHRRIARARDLIKAYAREYGRVFRLCAYKNMAYAAHELIFKHGGHQRGKHILTAAAFVHRNAP